MPWVTKPRRELDTTAVCRRYDVNDKALDRWLERRSLGFPRPHLDGRRRVWWEHELDAFDACKINPPDGGFSDQARRR